MGTTDALAYAERIYGRIETLSDWFGGRFQLVISDNDPPTVEMGDNQQIDLSYDDLPHPGRRASGS